MESHIGICVAQKKKLSYFFNGVEKTEISKQVENFWNGIRACVCV